MADDTGDWLFDEDEAEWLAAWEEADRQAAEVLREACRAELRSSAPEEAVRRAASELRAGLAGGAWPFDYFVNACGWSHHEDLPDGDLELWLSALAASISPPHDPGTDAEEQSAVAALMHADWLGMIVGLVRRGVGAEFSAEAALHDIVNLPELEGEIEDPDGQLSVLSMAAATVTPLWEALGVLDDESRLSALGRWGLPNALLVTWSAPGADELDAAADPGQRPDQLDETAAETALAVLARRPMSLEELRRAVAKEGVFASTEQLSASLIWRMEVYEFLDGVWAHIPGLADGVLLTHRLTDEELDLGVLDVDLDLDLLGLQALDGHQVTDVGEVKTRFRVDELPLPGDASTGVAGPDGWLAGFSVGDLLGVKYADGKFALTRVDLPAEDETRADVQMVIETARAAAELDAIHGDPAAPGASGTEIVLRGRRGDPGLFTAPLPPLSEILADVDGLEVERGCVGITGTAWHGEPSWLDDQERSTYRTWRRVLAAHRQGDGVPETAELESLAESLGDRLLSLVAFDLAADPEREPVAVAMEEAVSGTMSAVPLYLRATAAEGRGDGAAWVVHLERAVAADQTCRDAAGDLADLRSVVGDAREAHRLYGLAGLDTTTPEMQILARFLQPPEGTGRNKPCPCGSGKKYKVCHGRTDAHPLSSRAPWLWLKVHTFAQRGVNRADLLDWAEMLSGESRESREVVLRAMEDPLVVDFAVFGGDLLERFLDVLGPLLPADELELTQKWVGSPLRLMEVLKVQPMRGVRVRDLVSGEEIDVLDRRMTTDVAVKDLLLGRPLDDGSGDLRFQVSPLSIPRLMRGRLLPVLKRKADAEDVAMFLADAGRQPETRTTEGEEIVMCTARYDLASPEETWDLLAADLAPGDDGRLIDEVEVPGHGRVVRGTLRRTGSLLIVETNALERLRRIQGRVLAADPEARLIDESTRPLAELLEEGQSLGGPPPGSPQPAPQELEPEVMRQVVRQHEDGWIDGPLPALDGRTPREAAQDPILRDELVALLDDFEWENRRNPGPLTMDVARLRRELGISGA